MSNLLEKASILLTPTAYDDGKILSVKPIQTFGSELVVNGDFADNSTWTTQSSVTFTNGTVIMDSASINAYINQNILTVGRKYRVSITVEALSIVDKLDLINPSGITYKILGVGVNVFEITANQTAFRIRTKDGATSTISRASVQEITDGDFDFTRNSSATRVNSQGLIEDMQTFGGNLVSNGDFSQEGAEEVTNGNFATDSDWALTQATISGGYLNISTTDGSFSGARQFVFTVGKTYLVSLEISNIVGTVEVDVNSGSVYGQTFTTNGSKSFYLKAENTDIEVKRAFGAEQVISATIDNVSVKEVGQDWTLGTGWSIGDNKLTFDSNNITGNPTTFTTATIDIPIFVIGKKYRVTLTDLEILAGSIEFKFGRTFSSNPARPILTSADNGTYVDEFVAVTTSRSFTINNGGARIYGSIGSVSVIEITDDTNLPRIDYSPYSGAGTCGHWLFEPQSTQTATHSNDFTQGDIFNSSSPPTLQETVLTSQQAISPDGTNNAWKLVDNNDGLTGQASLSYFSTTVIANNYNTISYFVKKQGSNNFVYITNSGFDTGANGQTWFDIQNGTLGNVSANHTANIENYGNGWYRISITNQAVTDIVGAFTLRLATSNGSGNILRDGTNGVYLFGVQAESDASRQFMTSYIPTSGSTVTRNQEAAFGAGNSSLINSTEGTLYADIAALANDLTFRDISLSDGTQSNRVDLGFNTINSNIQALVRTTNGANKNYSTNAYTITSFNKIAISYAENNFSFWVNGVKAGGDTSGNTPIGLSKLAFDSGNGSADFYGKTKCVAVFKEALTDDELECLTSDETSFSSFNALALANNYTII